MFYSYLNYYLIVLSKGLGSEDCNPLNMSIEAEMAIEQMKEQHHRDLHHLKQELEDTVSVGRRWSLRSLPSQTNLGFCDPSEK